MNHDGLNDDILKKMTEIVDGEQSENEELVEELREFTMALGPEEALLLSVAQFLGREAMLKKDKRLFYASAALLAMTGTLEVANEGEEPVTLSYAMDLAEESYEASVKYFDQALDEVTDELIGEFLNE